MPVNENYVTLIKTKNYVPEYYTYIDESKKEQKLIPFHAGQVLDWSCKL